MTALKAILEPHVEAIMASARKGNLQAKEIIIFYRRAFNGDEIAPRMCRAIFQDWQRRQD